MSAPTTMVRVHLSNTLLLQRNTTNPTDLAQLAGSDWPARGLVCGEVGSCGNAAQLPAPPIPHTQAVFTKCREGCLLSSSLPIRARF